MAGSANYMLRFGADAGSVTKAITGINGDLRSLNSQSRNLKSAFTLTGDTSVLQQRLRVLQQTLTGTEKKGELLKKELADMKASPGFDANSKRAQQLTRDIAKTDTEATKLKAEIANVEAGGLDDVSSSADKASHSLGVGKIAVGAFLGSLASKAVTTFASVVGRAFEGVGQDIISASDGIQKFQSTMGFAGKSAGEIQKLTNASKKYADDTVYDLTDVLNTTAQLGANGVKNYGQLVQASGNLNAVAGGNADTFKSVAMVMTQTAGAGKLTTENWNQLSDAIPGASGKLQEAMKKNGAFTGNFRDAMEKGQISAGEFNKAIMQLGMTDVAKKAAASTSTFEGAFGNMQASFVTAGLDFLNQFKKPITDGMTAISNAVPKLSKAFGAGLQNMGKQANDITTPLGNLVNTVKTIAGEITNAFANMDLSNLTSAFSNLKLPTLDFTPLTTLVYTIVPAIANAFANLHFDGLVNLANAIIPAVMAGFQTFLGWVVPAIQPLLNAFVNLWNAIQPVATIIASVLTPAFQVLGSFLGGFVGGVMGTLTFAFNAAAIAIRALTPVVSMVAGVFRSLSPVISMIAGILGTVLGASVNLIGATFSRVGAAIGRAWQSMSGVVRGASNTVRSIIQAVGNVIRTVANVFRSSGSSMGGAIRGAASVIRGAGSSIMGVARNIIGSFRGIGGRIASGFSGVLGKIGSHFSGAVSKIGSYFSGVSSIGRNIVNGIVSGVTGAAGSLYSALSNLAGNALSAAKKKLGIHSPSRVFRDEVGRYITQGIGVGMEKESLSSSAEQVKQRLLNDFSGTQLNTGIANGSLLTSQGVSQASNSSMVFNISANTKSDASAIANEVKLVLRQNGIKAR